MNKIPRILIVTLVFIMGLITAQDIRSILKNNIHLRQGPGCYYPLIKILNIGDSVNVLSLKTGWAEVNHKDTTGWIFNKCFSPKKNNTRVTDKIIMEDGPTSISNITASGAVKGFTTKHYGKSDGGHKKFLSKSFLDIKEYKAIKTSMTNNRHSRKKYRNLTKKKKDFHIDSKLQNIGDLVVEQIATKGFITDKKKLSYINSIGTLILEETDMYYHQVKIFIIDDHHKAAYATPNGMVFITTGLLEMIQDEAELACVLGHEISHIIYQHGYEELEERKVVIKADGAFASLDMEIGEEKSKEQNGSYLCFQSRL